MGQKVNPKGLRVGVIKNWDSRWYADKQYSEYLLEDYKIRQFLKKRLADTSLSRVEIERAANRVRINIHTAKPGIVIGRGGTEIENLRLELKKLTGKQVYINVLEINDPDMDAQLVAESVAKQLEGRIGFRRAMKQAMLRTRRSGAEGIKIMCSGRLGGAEIARTEWVSDGKVPLHTLRADIDYATDEADTTYGKIGIKVWIYKGEILGGRPLPVSEVKEKSKDKQSGKRQRGDKPENRKKATEEGV